MKDYNRSLDMRAGKIQIQMGNFKKDETKLSFNTNEDSIGGEDERKSSM